jgi:hypothetical protein
MTDSKPAKAPKAAAAKASTPSTPPPSPAAPAAPAAQPYAQPQPYAQQLPYGATSYQPGLVPPTNTLAIVALILGFVVPLGGIIAGHIALGQIKRTGEGGQGLALAGTIIGYVLTGLGLLVLLFYIIFFVALFGSGIMNPGTVI